MACKLGMAQIGPQDTALIEDLMELMEEYSLDFTLTFRRLADLINEPTADGGGVGDLFAMPSAMQPWLERWKQRLTQETTSPDERQASMYRANPIIIPRNHLVEAALEAATNKGDFAPFNQLGDAVAQPYSYQPELAPYATPPEPEQIVQQTFCGT